MKSSITAEHGRAWPASQNSTSAVLDKLVGSLAILTLCASTFASWFGQPDEISGRTTRDPNASKVRYAENESVVSVYAGAPVYHRSDLQLQRPDDTDMALENLGWDGDAFYFPVDGGARFIRWSGAFGAMIDFTHNKAVTRLGKGAHGRKIEGGSVEDAETVGVLKGQPAPSPLHLTDLFERLEFTHGHNVLMPTGLVRLPPLTPRVRPYIGVGFGVSVPHVEVRFVGEESDRWTSEYQYAGPAFQFLAGLELRIGRGLYFVEYKFIWSAISAALSGSKSWSLKDLRSTWLPRWFIEPFSGLTEMPLDLWHQFERWRSGAPPAEGFLQTHLTLHEIVVGAGYVRPGAVRTAERAVAP